ncbi:MAG TPA: acetate--CoA ligase [Planctomycetes bacterium]|nr:acetate--CoA ligase [Planctomycetota bacterium]
MGGILAGREAFIRPYCPLKRSQIGSGAPDPRLLWPRFFHLQPSPPRFLDRILTIERSRSVEPLPGGSDRGLSSPFRQIPAATARGLHTASEKRLPRHPQETEEDPLSETIENLFQELRSFPPSPEFSRAANAQAEVYERATSDPLAFWEEEAGRLRWKQRWHTTLDESRAPFYQWFVGGKLNVTESCLDLHLATDGDRTAFFWEGESGDSCTITYRELHEKVCRLGNAMRKLGIAKGDTVAIYMGMVPEIVVAMLACARIGAAHSVIFGGFSSDSIRERVDDAGSTAVITCDGSWRRGKVVPLKANVDASLEGQKTVKHVIVVRRTENEINWVEGRDNWYHDIVSGEPPECEPEVMDAEDLLFILYTSGSTGKPKGIAHTCGGYLTGVSATTRMVFDIKGDDVYWCTADCGWVTGHSYIVYGPLANGATSFIFEGTPDYPERDRWWELIEKYRVSILYTAPTAIRTFMKWGDSLPAGHDLSSLRLLGSVGEPINPEAWMWYQEKIGGGRCPVVDTWWQTETGSIMITPLPGITTTKPGSATHPFPGIEATVVDEDGNEVGRGHGGFLVVKRPWPAMLRNIHGDPERYKEVYWSKFPGLYFPGDGCKIDDDGYLWLLGRVDDVMLVSGHNISTTEVESALVDHPSVAESAVVGRADDRTGQAIAAFVILRGDIEGNDELISELRGHVAEKIGPIAKPSSIVFTPDLPKTRSGKIMRRLLRDISEKRKLGDVTTLANADVVEAIRTGASSPASDE